ncbi:BON domain-containing protein [Tibeticola sediminis]|jgi:osmotically-inducible protein OsmY|uniref:Osmotically-inducible protein Y n=1 Tax=Tibeticola sediminis TaxID=1917811 RepID=A0A3N4US61_9BURK|nr:BON domain-containing protein [Tibeticola sediminis]RPE72993.1 BON domain-containing protein [Tibeticola sediminis]
MLALALCLGMTGCAVVREQETLGAYVDDATITATIKARLLDDTTVSAAAIKVETLQGVVILSGFAKSAAERARAEQIARSVRGVRSVQNSLIVR